MKLYNSSKDKVTLHFYVLQLQTQQIQALRPFLLSIQNRITLCIFVGDSGHRLSTQYTAT
jgi:hypothetical protein